MPLIVYKNIERAFKKLWGYPDNQLPDSDYDGVPFLTEQHFVGNLKYVLGVTNPYISKMFYLYFSNGYDLAKISIQNFFHRLKPFVLEERYVHSETSFKVLDIDNDGKLNVLNLLQMFQNVPSSSRLGQELFKVIEFFLEKNLHSRSINQVQITMVVYLKLCNQKPCLNQEIRAYFLGIGHRGPVLLESEEEDEDILKPKPKRVGTKVDSPNHTQKIESPTSPSPRFKYKSCFLPNCNVEDRSLPVQYMFQNIDMVEDMGMGQRGFDRNIDRLGN